MSKQKSYWQSVLAEVLNKEKMDNHFIYTNLGSSDCDFGDDDEIPLNPKPRRERVVLDGEFSGIYLTPREVDCLIGLSTGSTVKVVARELALSHRTVEFYLKNLKAKFGCTTKSELLAIVAQADLLSSLEFYPEEDDDYL